MKTVVLDRLPLDPGDMDWARILAGGSLELWDATSLEDVADRIRDADIVLTNKVPLTAHVLATAERLKLISVLATGYDVVDVAAARAQCITVCNVPAYSADFTAQTAIALLLELTHHSGDHNARVRGGEWQCSKTFSFWSHPLVQLSGKTAVIVGMGNIGRRVGTVLSAFGMRVIAAQRVGRQSAVDGAYGRMQIDEAVAAADVISLHAPLTPETRDIINGRRLALMKSTVLIINTARGGLVNESDLAAALARGAIGGYATDVLSREPPSETNPLLAAPRCIISPHLGWAAPEARALLISVTADNIDAWQQGKSQNVVS